MQETAIGMEMLEGVVNELPDLSKPRLPDVKPADLSSKACKSDDFRMYAFKIKRCSRTRAHDWTQCPYAHRGEKARRRDPCKFNYAGIACPDFRRPGGCPRGDACEFAHGVFEFWLHPARYRTRACKAGRCCQRKVCFFAHTPEQLRGGATKYACNTLRSQAVEEAARSLPAPVGLVAGWEDCCLEEGMRALKIGDEMDSPDIDWVLDLVG